MHKQGRFSGEHDRNLRPIHEGNIVSVVKQGEELPRIGTVKVSVSDDEEEWRVVLRDKNISLELESVLHSIVVVADATGEGLSDTRDHAILHRVKEERAHQEEKWGTNEENPHTVLEWAHIMVSEAKEAMDEWMGQGGMLTYHEVMNELLQATAVGWAAMEQHSVMSRNELDVMRRGLERADHYNQEDFKSLISGLDLDEYALMCRSEIMLRSGMGLQTAKITYPDDHFEDFKEDEIHPDKVASDEIDSW